MTFEQISRRLGAKRVGSSNLAKCPAHEDKTASLSISEGNDGRILLYCHAGCEVEDIASAMGLTMGELFADDPQPTKAKSRIVAEYDYRDEHGELLYQALRMEPKDFRQRRPEAGGWNWSTKGVRRVLYRLPDLQKLAKGARVYVVEGEKDADRLQELGCAATTNVGGAGAGKGKWLAAYTAQLEGFSVVVLPDNDEPGRAHAKAICEQVPGATICELPGLPEKGDVSDWLAAGGTAAELNRLADPNRVPGFESFADRLDEATAQREEHIKRVIPFNISYLDDCCIGIHPTDLIVIGASTGAGKTTLGSLLARKAATDGRQVYFFALEAFKSEIETRLLFAAICACAHQAGDFRPWMTMAQWLYGKCPQLDRYQETAKDLIRNKMRNMHTYYRGSKFDKDDITRLFGAIRNKADLIILDHLHYIDSDGPNDNSEMKKIVQAIRDAALAMQVPVVVIAHLRKKQGGVNAREVPDIEDIHGSSEVIKIATKIVMVAPARSEEFSSTDPAIANTFMQVVKDRYAGVNGYAALVQYELAAMSYRKKYTVCRVGLDGKVSIADKRPGWATEAMRV